MSRPIRYLVYMPDCTVGYHCSLGNREARSWAIHTAARYGGVIKMEAADGSFDVFRDYRWRPWGDEADQTEPAAILV